MLRPGCRQLILQIGDGTFIVRYRCFRLSQRRFCLLIFCSCAEITVLYCHEIYCIIGSGTFIAFLCRFVGLQCILIIFLCLRQFLLQRCGIRLLLLQLHLQGCHIVRHARTGSIADRCRIGSTDLLGIVVGLGFQQGQFISTLCLRIVCLRLHYRILQQCPNCLHAVFREFQQFLAFGDTLPAGSIDLFYLQIFLYGIIVILVAVILVIVTDIQIQIVIYGFCVVFQRAALSNTYL